MARYRKKPVVIEAMKNEGEWRPVMEWLTMLAGGGFVFQPGQLPPITRNADGSLNIQTPEGVMRADIGDFIIQGIRGEFYLCKPDIFEATYEKVEA